MATMSSRLDANMRRRGWPTLDVLELDGHLPATELLLQTSGDAVPASLGWIESVAARYQLRLLVLPTEPASTRIVARQLAAHLVERGGPTVVIAPPDRRGATQHHQAGLRQLYAGLIHDLPLDAAVRQVPGVELFQGLAAKKRSEYRKAPRLWSRKPLRPALR
jgi:hypothetical protein